MSHTEDEKKAIRNYAFPGGPRIRLHDEAIEAHRALLTRVRRSRDKLPYGDPYFEFMREIDTPAPDYSLRAMYRQKILHERS